MSFIYGPALCKNGYSVISVYFCSRQIVKKETALMLINIHQCSTRLASEFKTQRLIRHYTGEMTEIPDDHFSPIQVAILNTAFLFSDG